MALTPVALKRRNHRLLHCASKQKNALLARLIREHTGKNILVITAGDASAVSPHENVTVLTDATLDEAEGRTFELLISFDLPETPQDYMLRLGKTSGLALILLDEEDRPRLYGIETLLGRTIIQENVPEFAPKAEDEVKKRPKHRSEAKGKGGKKPYADKRKFDGEGKNPSVKGKKKPILRLKAGTYKPTEAKKAGSED